MNTTRDAKRTPLSLSELIKKHQEDTGDSYQDIANKAGLSKAKIGQFADPDYTQGARLDTLHKLATALRQPIRTVDLAARVTAGQDVTDSGPDPRIEMITHQLERLNERDLSTVEIIVSSLVNRRDG